MCFFTLDTALPFLFHVLGGVWYSIVSVPDYSFLIYVDAIQNKLGMWDLTVSVPDHCLSLVFRFALLKVSRLLTT